MPTMKKDQIFKETDDAIKQRLSEKPLPLSKQELKELANSVINRHLKKIDDPATYLVDNFDLSNPQFQTMVHNIVLETTRAEYEARYLDVLIRQYADNFEATMTHLTSRIKSKMELCGEVGQQMIQAIDKAMENPRANITKLAVCIAQAPGVAGRNVSSEGKAEMTAIAKPFQEAMERGLANVVTKEANVTLAKASGPYERFIFTPSRGEEFDFSEITHIRFVYDCLDQQLIFSQTLWDDRWGSLTDDITEEELQGWIERNLSTSSLAKLGWTTSDEAPEWAQQYFLTLGKG